MLEPPGKERQKAECRRQNPESTMQAQLRKEVAQPLAGTRRAYAGPASSPHLATGACSGKVVGRCVHSQVKSLQHLTRPPSDRPRTTTGPRPGQRRWHVHSSGRVDSTGLPRWSFGPPQIRRTAARSPRDLGLHWPRYSSIIRGHVSSEQNPPQEWCSRLVNSLASAVCVRNAGRRFPLGIGRCARGPLLERWCRGLLPGRSVWQLEPALGLGFG